MTTELVTSDAELNTEMRYAQAVAKEPERGQAQSLLPAAYRGNPANVLIAVGLGKAIGIPPAQALYEVYVVNGRPSPSANLMAALVRRAGHKLRLEGDDTRCTATLIRADDPDAPFAATWTIEQAQRAGLTKKGGPWKDFPGAMLRSRAISEVVRMGASEAVLGMDYSAEEMRDVPAAPATPAVSAASFAKRPVEEVHDAEVVPDAEPEPISQRTRGQLFALFSQKGIVEADQLPGVNHLVGKAYYSRSEITEADALAVIEVLKQRPDAEGKATADAADEQWTAGGEA